MTKLNKLAAGLCCLALSGCSPLASQPDRLKYYILTPQASFPSSISDPGLSVGIGPIDFPDYLRGGQIMTRAAPNRLEVSQAARWAEPLDKNFERILAENISNALHTRRIEKYPWPLTAHVDYKVQVAVLRFETGADGQSTLTARWIIKDGHNGKDLYAAETDASASVGAGDAGASAALSDDLGKLSTDIATRLAALAGARDHSRNDAVFPISREADL